MRTFVVSLIVVAVLGFSQRAEATRQVRVYEATVSSQTEAAVQAQAALRQVLVRATGARDAANDPALAGLLANAQAYVLGTRPAGSGSSALVVMFDGAALERDIIAAGRSIWLSERPVLLVVLTGGPASGAFESRRQVEGALDAAASRRGQPISVARPEALSLPATGDIPADAALAAGRIRGADAVLVGNGDAVPGGGPWRWTLNAFGNSETWNGTLEEGIHGSADILARNSAAYAALPELAILVEVEGVPALKDYARVAELLGAANGVRSVQLAEASGNRAIFAVVARGGVDVVQTGLGGNAHLERADPQAGGTIAYRYRP
ncbi:MAG TPA: DUF2066 domain-containing protein [Steroidobacteraceae bacterium]|nr:DUF2066 domain-containing protein [Steroidobacteraceae bacterium]